MKLHSFKLKLTKKQREEVSQAWASHGGTGCVMFCQPIFHDGGVVTNFALYDVKGSQRIGRAVNAANKP